MGEFIAGCVVTALCFTASYLYWHTEVKRAAYAEGARIIAEARADARIVLDRARQGKQN